MSQRVLNFFRLIRIIKERGNWPLIRRSRRQLLDFVLCRNDIHRKPLWAVPFYWLDLLKGLDMLVWRLETFGFLFQNGATPEERARLNQNLNASHP
ncbi:MULTISPECIES: hypothetical protein [unclassified Nitrospina]|uniref:hypothetical protein n=1 Tax=unclassified Nitrospina TaxID=2638683 RepID=UPI003F9792A2